MSDEYFKEVAEKVRSGEYFEDAREWYKVKYLAPVIERAYFILLGFLAITLIVIAFATLISYMPLEMHKPVFADIQDQSDQYATFRPLGNRADIEEDPQPELQKYLLTKFIEAYESYDFRDDFARLKRNETLLKTLSSDEMLENYRSYVSTSNPDSPILRYRNTAILEVTVDPYSYRFIEQLNISGESGRRYVADATFTLIKRTSTEVTRDKYRAKIVFLYQDIRYDRKTEDFTPMSLKVVDYAAERIE